MELNELNGTVRNVDGPPVEVETFRENLKLFMERDVDGHKLGNYKWGVYVFYDYDGEPIYVGCTSEGIRTRIARHLTNQRSDAVAMGVLDPLEVYKVMIWPLPQFQAKKSSDPKTKKYLATLEKMVYDVVAGRSEFKAVLNEKQPIASSEVDVVELPTSYEAIVVSPEIFAFRRHPDIRIARRAQIVAHLAQVIKERKVNDGLRQTLTTQVDRLLHLTKKRLKK